MANSLARSQVYFCNLVGSAKFAPCASAFGGNTNVAGNYPANFFEVNPYTTGLSLNYLDAMGHSNYNSLQVELRQRQVHGMQFNVNYTLGKSLILGPANAYQGNVTSSTGSVAGLFLTDRNFRMNYGPSPFDIRHIVHASGTYDLPFGKGKKFLNQSKLANEIVGGWTLGTIVILQSGTPIADERRLQHGQRQRRGRRVPERIHGEATPGQRRRVSYGQSVRVHVRSREVPRAQRVGQRSTYMTPNTNAGAWGYRPMIYGPHWFNADVSVNKTIPIRENRSASRCRASS